ncbi:MAG TPA: glycosyl hydrolase family 79 C-terminal domain-containing protein [Trebonia sp.]|nr:glycosyl hydrolase family 79 C-terminal domain-containing protein [Trebonia sp.]
MRIRERGRAAMAGALGAMLLAIALVAGACSGPADGPAGGSVTPISPPAAGGGPPAGTAGTPGAFVSPGGGSSGGGPPVATVAPGGGAGGVGTGPGSGLPTALPRPGPFTATVVVHASARPLGAIGDRYTGLSFESGTLNSGQFTATGNLPRLLRNLGPALMRFGGLTADQAAFTGISPGALAGLAALARASGWQVIYSENLGHFNAAAVRADARAVAGALGPHLAAIGCGNEPDGFPVDRLRPKDYTVGDYLTEADACLAAVRAGAPRAPLEGADLTGARDWLSAYAAREKGRLAIIGQHLYGAGCVRNYAGLAPQVADAALLSPSIVTKKEIPAFQWLVADAASAGARPVISEVNSVCSGGLPGVSNSFAAALWSINFMLTGAEHGVTGVNFHGGLTGGLSTSGLTSTGDCFYYSALCPTPGDPGHFTIRPLYYGLLFTHLLGAGAMLPVTVGASAPRAYVTAFAVRPASGGTRVMLENMTGSPATIALDPGTGPRAVDVTRLTAPGLTATSGLRIAGASVGPDGAFTPGRPLRVACPAGRCRVLLAPFTAAIVATSAS